jgi:proliferating cell nuclear antigen
MTIRLDAKTLEGHVVKTLTELLQNNIKNGCYEIDKDGIYFRMTDSNKRILFDLELNNENFSIYRFNGDKIYMGINQSHLYKMLKSVKKKDSVEFIIDDERPNDLAINIIPKEKNRVTTSYIKLQNIQNLDIDVPEGYGKPIIVSASDYQKMCKDMSKIGSTIKVSSKQYSIKFNCNSCGVYSREEIFGETEHDDKHTPYKNEQDFDTEQLCRIAKIAGLSHNMQIFQEPDLPLLFRTSVGTLGKISIYVKSKIQIEEDEQNNMLRENE